MRMRGILVVMLAAAGGGVAASFVWGPALRPVIGGLMILMGLMQFTPLMYRTEDGGRLPPMPWAKWLGAAFICQGAAQLVPEGAPYWVLMTAAFIALGFAFAGIRKRRAAV